MKYQVWQLVDIGISHLEQLNKYAVDDLQRFRIYANSEKANPEKVKQWEIRLQVTFTYLDDLKVILESALNQYNEVRKSAFVAGLKEGENRANEKRQNFGIDPKNYTRAQKEALRHYSIANQRLIDNI